MNHQSPAEKYHGRGKPHVIIVGGGLSGLAAAVSLCPRNIPLTLFEQRPHLGGRAYSFIDAVTGEVIDNGQHILIAGYDRTMKFLDTIGTRSLVDIQSQPSLIFHHPGKGFRKFALPKLPPPLHLLAGIFGTDLFTWRDKLRLVRAGIAIRRPHVRRPGVLPGARRTDGPEQERRGVVHAGGIGTRHPGIGADTDTDLTVAQWLDKVGQSWETRRSFWEPLAVSIMNEHITKAPAAVFINSLRHAFLSRWNSAALAVSRVGLSELYVDPAAEYILKRGAAIHTRTRVAKVITDDRGVTGVKLSDSSELDCSALILAMPMNTPGTLLSLDLPAQLSLSGLPSLPCTPIISIHLWFDEDFMPHDVVGVIGRRLQWIFNRRRIAGPPPNSPYHHGGGLSSSTIGPERHRRKNPTMHPGHVSCTISAADEFIEWRNEELVQLALDDLRSVYAMTPERTLHAVVIRERRATFSLTSEVERARPPARTGIPNLFLAGDWTDTGYPATIEGAILSGERAAALVQRLTGVA